MEQSIASGHPRAGLGLFERYLTLWVALCIVAGISLGSVVPAPFHVPGRLSVASVNVPVALLIWLMIIPMLLRVDFGASGTVTRHWRGIIVTLVVNWLVKPFSMALLGWLFIRGLFHSYLPADQIDSYIAGLILLAAAPCTAMVFVWSNLSDGDPNFTLSQVALNDAIMIVAFAPIVIQVYFNAGLAYVFNRTRGSLHSVAAPSALIGASNFFELAVAAISLFGFKSGAALATVVGVLVEVPVMVSVVRIVMATRGWYARG